MPERSGEDVKRLRLFAPGRPTIYVFPTMQGFCARLLGRPIESIDTAPWRAIDTLRHAVAQYERMFGRPEQRVEEVSSQGRASHAMAKCGDRSATGSR
jgi:hypothetical protein